MFGSLLRVLASANQSARQLPDEAVLFGVSAPILVFECARLVALRGQIMGGDWAALLWGMPASLAVLVLGWFALFFALPTFNWARYMLWKRRPRPMSVAIAVPTLLLALHAAAILVRSLIRR